MSEVEGLRNTVKKLKSQLAKAQSERDIALRKMSELPDDEDAYKPLVVLTVNESGIARPHCEIHGAMLCVNPELTLYRCPECDIGVDVASLNEYIKAEMADLLKWVNSSSSMKCIACTASA